MWERKLKEKFELPTPLPVDEEEWSVVLDSIELEGSRRRRTNVAPPQRHFPGQKAKKQTEDSRVKTASHGTEIIINSEYNPENDVKTRETISKLKALNILISNLLSQNNAR